MADKTDEERALILEAASEFLPTLVRMVKEHQAQVTNVMLVSSALLEAVSERFPEIANSYQRHLRRSATTSPLALSTPLIIAQLEELLEKMKPDV